MKTIVSKNLTQGVSVGICTLLIALANFPASVQTLSPNPKPYNVTALAGNSATFACGPAEPGALVTWSVAIVSSYNSSTFEPIFEDKELFHIDPTTLQPVYAANVSNAKFGVTDTYDLVVKDVTSSDAVPYFCSSPNASDVNNRAYANLIVIVNLTASSYPSTDCQFVTLNCDIFASTPISYIASCPPQDVRFSVIVGNEPVGDNWDFNEVDITHLSTNVTIFRQNLNNQTQFTCLVTSMSEGHPYQLLVNGSIAQAACPPAKGSFAVRSTGAPGNAILLAVILLLLLHKSFNDSG